MPELPEVETVCRTLSPLLTGQVITEIELIRPEVVQHPLAADFALLLGKRTFRPLLRRGKFLLLPFAEGGMLVIHLRMTGRLLLAPASHPRPLHTHVVFHLDNGCELRFSDVRRFGRLWYLAAEEEDAVTGMQHLGVEPLSRDFSATYLAKRLSQRRSPIKAALLDQRVIAGLGNIYVDETLFRARIAPMRQCHTLSTAEWQAIADAVGPVLLAAIENNGTTFRDFRDGEGREGQNMPYLSAYGRGGKACRSCGTPIEKTRVAGRGTYYCPCCQKNAPEENTMVIGLIGNIGSGKSTAAAHLAALGATVIYADQLGHEVLQPGSAVYQQVLTRFGEEYLTAAGTIDRKKLGAHVFAEESGAALRSLNAITHPAIAALAEEKIAAAFGIGVKVVVLEAAILLGSPLQALCDEIWLITADKETQIQRTMKRDGCSRSQAEDRLKLQQTQAEMAAAADVTIENNGSKTALRKQLAKLWAERVRV